MFSDQDVAKLKEHYPCGMCPDNDKYIPALLARLEAAERVCDLVEQTADIYTNMKVLKAVKAWRASAGK